MAEVVRSITRQVTLSPFNDHDYYSHDIPCQDEVLSRRYRLHDMLGQGGMGHDTVCL